MVKHTQTIRRQQPTNCLNVFDHFVGLALEGLNNRATQNKLTQHLCEIFRTKRTTSYPSFSSVTLHLWAEWIYHSHIQNFDLLMPQNLFQKLGISHYISLCIFPANIYLLKGNNRNTRKRCEICSKLTIKTQERRHWRRSGIFIVNFEHILHLFLVFLLLTLNK